MKAGKVVLIIPAYNEELTIANVIEAYHSAYPELDLVVVDNNSKDRTSEIVIETYARLKKTNAYLLFESRQGKGNAVKKAFYSLDYDIYAMVDADCTYPVESLEALIEPIVADRADMTVGNRHSEGNYKAQNKRHFHNLGNNLVKGLINFLFKSSLQDILSGYRVFSKSFVKNFPILSKGFEIETEITLHALDKDYRIVEIGIDYAERPAGSESKLNTFTDGFKVIRTIAWIFKDYRPLSFFGSFGILMFVASCNLGYPVIKEYLEFRYIYRVPTAILSTGTMILSFISISIGVVLDTVVKINRQNFEFKKINGHN